MTEEYGMDFIVIIRYTVLVIGILLGIYVMIKNAINNLPENYTKEIENKNLPNMIGFLILGFKDIPYRTECMIIKKNEWLEFYFKLENEIIIKKQILISSIVNISSQKTIIPKLIKGHVKSNAHIRAAGFQTNNPIGMAIEDKVIEDKVKKEVYFESIINYNFNNEENKLIIASKTDLKYYFSIEKC